VLVAVNDMHELLHINNNWEGNIFYQKYALLNILPDIIFDLPAGWLSSQANWPMQLCLSETWSNISAYLW
jgi:hypothetical protein